MSAEIGSTVDTLTESGETVSVGDVFTRKCLMGGMRSEVIVTYTVVSITKTSNRYDVCLEYKMPGATIDLAFCYYMDELVALLSLGKMARAS